MVLRFFLFALLFLLISCTDFERDNPDDTGSINNVTYGGETYKTVVIGKQTWMARNMNYDVPDNDTDVCYDNDPANCAIYGRLYDWATAMALPDSCNSNSCASLISPKHQGICPSGWHIPSRDDWDALMDAVDEDIQLKAREGWSSYDNGTDEFGFSALPGGRYFLDGSFGEVGHFGYWWSANESFDNSNGAYGWNLMSKYLMSGKTDRYSVRCVN